MSYANYVRERMKNAMKLTKASVPQYVYGSSITIYDAVGGAPIDLTLYGMTKQNGTPTPQNPIDIVSLENPILTFGDQTVTVPYTLRGIDKDNQYMVDEIIVDGIKKTVKYIQRLREYVLDDTLMSNGDAYIDNFYETPALTMAKSKFGIMTNCWYEPTTYMRSYRRYNSSLPSHNNTFAVSYGQTRFGVCDSRFTDVETAKNLLRGEVIVVTRPSGNAYEASTDITNTECGQALLALKLNKGRNIISLTSNGVNGNIRMQYYRK